MEGWETEGKLGSKLKAEANSSKYRQMGGVSKPQGSIQEPRDITCLKRFLEEGTGAETGKAEQERMSQAGKREVLGRAAQFGQQHRVQGWEWV